MTPDQIVDLIYRAVLRRPPGPKGRENYVRLLAEGCSEVELVARLVQSREFASTQLVRMADIGRHRFDAYDPAKDPALAKYESAAFTSAVTDIRAPTLDRNRFRRAMDASLTETGATKAVGGDYLRFHRERFYEIDCAIENLLPRTGRNPTIMDFGLSMNSFIMRRLFPNVRLSIADRPAIRVPANKFHRVLPVDLLDDSLDSIDLGAKFDIIVFSEVIEHVLVHPARVVRFLLRHLTPSGWIILTTPNLFSRRKLQLISRRRSPLPPCPATYKRGDPPHLHVREYSMGEMLAMIEQAGGKIEAFFFSGCWDTPKMRETLPPDELGNMFFLFQRRAPD